MSYHPLVVECYPARKKRGVYEKALELTPTFYQKWCACAVLTQCFLEIPDVSSLLNPFFAIGRTKTHDFFCAGAYCSCRNIGFKKTLRMLDKRVAFLIKKPGLTPALFCRSDLPLK